MADFEFQITDGAYQGVYRIDARDLTAADVGDLLAQGGPDLDLALSSGNVGARVAAGLVWIVKRHNGAKVAFRAVADAVNFGNIAPVSEPAEADGASAPGLPDPSSSDGG